jgi:hypothetical protein
MDVPVCQTRPSSFEPMHRAIICFVGPGPAKSDSPVSETRGSRISRTLDESSKIVMAGPDDWRSPLVHYLKNHGRIADWKVWRQA